MRNTDLMIRDWVKVPSYYEVPPFQIGSITSDEVTEISGAEISFYISDVEPIPLTKEILDANGFKEHNDELILRRRKDELQYYYIEFFITTDNVFILDIESTNEKGTMSRFHSTSSFVHELQHALRVCGLDELANNFKV